MSTPAAPPPPGNRAEVPRADIRPAVSLSALAGRLASRMWLLTLISLLLAVGLLVATVGSRGTRITVHFREGHGIKPGDRLRYRGIEVGEVKAVDLAERLGGVEVELELLPNAAGLAREGSQFWIERPRLSLSRFSGLETVVGAKYLGVLPGPESAPPATEFEGLETPLLLLEGGALEIAVHFAEGHGLVVGDPLKYRGIVVGEVVAVELSAELQGVTVRVRLMESARQLARTGSQFWIEHPQVTWTGVRGLETIVGGRYLAVLPGSPPGESQIEFHGREQAPLLADRPEGGLEFVLEGDQRLGMAAGAPVRYRGQPVGHVISVGLALDGSRVEARVYVQPKYKQLVREHSRFWTTSGIDVSLGLSGIQLNTQNLETIAVGGVAFATPDQPGSAVSTGHRFTLHKKPESEWLEWRPNLLVANTNLPAGRSIPRPLRVALRWQEKLLGLTRQRQRLGWVLPLSDGRLLGPVDLLQPVAKAVDGESTLEIAGQSLKLTADRATTDGRLAVYHPESPVVPADQAWPLEHVSFLAEPAEALATTGPQDLNVSLPAARLSPAGSSWQVDPSLSMSADAHGACVVRLESGDLVGILLLLSSGKPSIGLLSQELLEGKS